MILFFISGIYRPALFSHYATVTQPQLHVTLSLKAVADLGGGGGTPGPCPPPFGNLFLHLPPPPFFVHVPPLLKPKKKKCRLKQKCVGSPPPPPPVWDLRDSRRWWRSEKKVLEPKVSCNGVVALGFMCRPCSYGVRNSFAVYVELTGRLSHILHNSHSESKGFRFNSRQCLAKLICPSAKHFIHIAALHPGV